jgi:transcription initiation factor TFIID subunit 2
LKKLQNSKRSQLFRKPVDPVRDKAPDYFNVIATPMDLSSIENKLNEGMYKDRHEFKDDFELVVSNAKTYTPDPKAFVHVEANALNREFQTLWTRISKTLAQAAANSLATTSNGVNGSHRDAAVSEEAEGEAVRGRQEEEERADSPEPVIDQPAPPSPKPISMPPPSAGPLKGLKIKFKARPSISEEPASASSASPPVAKEIKASPKPSSSPPLERPAPTASRSISPQKNNGSRTVPDATNEGEDRPVQPKKLKALLQTLKKMPEAFFFLRPVDPIADGAPTYYDEIKEPMDLATMETKVDSQQYVTMADFHADMQRIFANCRQFNPPGTVPVQYADTLSQAFDKEWKAVNVLKLEYNEVRSLQALLNKLKTTPGADLFLHPVDPVALGIPHYFNVIPRKDARDLSTIEAKLKSGGYLTLAQVDADIRLMLHNCLTFNADVPDIVELTKSFARQYDKLWAEVCVKVGAPKRKAGDAGPASVKRKK